MPKSAFIDTEEDKLLLTPEEVRHVAQLARLGLTPEEEESLRIQLSRVLDHIAMLEKLDTSHIEPTAQVIAQRNVSRLDETRPSLQHRDVLLNAPRVEEGFIRVPAVLEDAKPSGSDGVNAPQLEEDDTNASQP